MQSARSLTDIQRLREEDRDVTPVYDLAQYGYELRFYVHDNNVPTAMTPAVSAAQFQVVLHPFGGTNRNALLPNDVYMSNADSGAIAHAGNNTAYNTNFTLHSHATGTIAHMAIIIGFIENVSAWTSGSVTMTDVVFTITTHRASGEVLDRFVFQTAPTTAFSALGATGAQIFKCFEHVAPDVRLRTIDNAPINLNITINETVSGTNTRQVGIMPTFPLWGSPASVSKPWTVPQIIMNIKPGLNAVDFIGRG